MWLQYMNDVTFILIMLGINLAIMFAINWGKSFSFADIIINAGRYDQCTLYQRLSAVQ